jgi:hypothetical protein
MEVKIDAYGYIIKLPQDKFAGCPYKAIDLFCHCDCAAFEEKHYGGDFDDTNHEVTLTCMPGCPIYRIVEDQR